MIVSVASAIGITVRGRGAPISLSYVHEGRSYPRLCVVVNNRPAMVEPSVLRRCDRCGRGKVVLRGAWACQNRQA